MSLHTLRKRKTVGRQEELQEKPFACGICKKAFQHWESLKRHCSLLDVFMQNISGDMHPQMPSLQLPEPMMTCATNVSTLTGPERTLG